MKLTPRILVVITLSITISISAIAEPQKKKKKAAGNPAPAATLETSVNQKAGAATGTTQKKKKKKAAGNSAPAVTPEISPEQKTEVPVEAKAPLSAEKDPQRERWRISVEPYAILGSGHPGKGASDFDKPDGVAFSPEGLLFATDAKNRRVHIWDVKTKTRLAEFGHGIFGGEIVDIAFGPDGLVLVTDQTLNLAYAFVPPGPGGKDEKGKPLGPYDYQFKGTRFGEQGFDKLGGVAIDSRGRIYAVDAHLNDVRRFNPDGTADQTWKFEKTRADGDTYLHGCEGIAIDETKGNLFIASEKDAVIQIFDWESGAHKGKLIGAGLNPAGTLTGVRIFSGSVEGLAIGANHLFAVDESVGHIQIFDLSRPGVFNTDLTAMRRNNGYNGFFGHSSLVDFEDKTNKTLQQQVKDGAIIPGQANPPGYFCSPDAIASYFDKGSGETYIAIADQCNYRLAVYRWSDISKAIAPVVASSGNAGAQATTTKGGKKNKKKGL
jgi:hypothetical protein